MKTVSGKELTLMLSVDHQIKRILQFNPKVKVIYQIGKKKEISLKIR